MGNAPEVCQCCPSSGIGARRLSPLPRSPGRGTPVPTHPPSGALDHMTSTQVRPSSTPQIAVNDIGTAEDFLAAIDQTIKYFNDGDIVEGVIVKVDRDEVLLDIGYKTEGVIPSPERSTKHDADPTAAGGGAATRPGASAPRERWPASTTSPPTRSSRSATRWKPSSSRRRTRKAA